NRKENIVELNSKITFLKTKLRAYLRSIEFEWKQEINNFISQIIFRYHKVTIIDFNYTNTINQYIDHISFTSPVLSKINIHGSLTEENEIFGYGNDLDKEYQRLKELEEDYILENFKTVNYMMDNKYAQFISDINQKKDFDVFVIGHSLGLTDKTLLQEIFDHPNCKNIHLLKRRDLENDLTKQKQEFKKLIMSITRIMKKESDVRKKVSNFKDSLTFPVKPTSFIADSTPS
ncbi:MAG: AbiH family protein, partial [Bacteroidota bacterium]